MNEPDSSEFRSDRLHIRYEDNLWWITPLTRLDLTYSEDFLRQVSHHLNANPSDSVCDMSQVPYMSSSGVKALLNIQQFLKMHHFRFALCDLTPEVQKLVELSELASVFTIFRKPADVRKFFP